jgi:hypothetical protein
MGSRFVIRASHVCTKDASLKRNFGHVDLEDAGPSPHARAWYISEARSNNPRNIRRSTWLSLPRIASYARGGLGRVFVGLVGKQQASQVLRVDQGGGRPTRSRGEQLEAHLRCDWAGVAITPSNGRVGAVRKREKVKKRKKVPLATPKTSRMNGVDGGRTRIIRLEKCSDLHLYRPAMLLVLSVRHLDWFSANTPGSPSYFVALPESGVFILQYWLCILK